VGRTSAHISCGRRTTREGKVLVNVEHVQRRSDVLTPSDLPCLKRVCSVNVSAGCAHECTYCYSRSYSRAPAPGTLVFYANTLEKMKAEWPRKRKKPDTVYFCPSSDVFQPVPEILDMAHGMLAFVLEMGARVAITTKGIIPTQHMALLAAHSDRVHVQMGLITHTDEVRVVVEPNAATVDVRVSQAKTLVDAGAAVKLRIAPILPFITDDDQTLSELCQIAVDCGIRDLAINAPHLRPGIRRSLEAKLPREMARRLFTAYDDAETLQVCGEYRQTSLAAKKRKGLFERAKRIAEEYGLRAHVCGCMNPDISDERCFLAGGEPARRRDAVQMSLFDALE